MPLKTISEKKSVTVSTYEELYTILSRLIQSSYCKAHNVRVFDLSDGGYRIEYEEVKYVIDRKLTAGEYQKLCRRTQNETLKREETRSHALFGMSSEVGEVMSIFQHEYQGKPADKEKVIDEVGDLLWFVCELLDTYDTSLLDVMEYNINKLMKRYPQGFDAERSEHRHEQEK